MSSFLALHTWRQLNTFYYICVTLGMSLLHTLVAPETLMNSGAGFTQIGLVTLILAGHTLATSLRRQDIVTLSTFEAKVVAASQAGQEALYLRETVKDFGSQQQNATEIYEDNLACVVMSENPVRRNFSRHIDIHCYSSCVNSSRQVLSNTSFCAHIKWSLPSPSLCLHPLSSATIASWWAKRLLHWSFALLMSRCFIVSFNFFFMISPDSYFCDLPNVFYKCPHCAWGGVIHHPSTT